MWMIRKSSWSSNCKIQQLTLKKNETTCIETQHVFMKQQRKAETAHLRIHQVQEKDQSISAQTCKKKPKHPLIQTFKFIQKFIPLSEKNTI